MKKLSIIIIILSLFTIPILNAQVNTQDSLALVSIYKANSPYGWGSPTNWLTKSPVSSWSGVGLDVNNHVDSLNITGGGGGQCH